MTDHKPPTREEGRSANGRPRFDWRDDPYLTPEDRRWFEEKEAQTALWPYLTGGRSGDEWYGHCPLHLDAIPSASFNFRKGVWHCYAGCGGGSIADLLAWPEGWVPRDEHPRFAGANGKRPR